MIDPQVFTLLVTLLLLILLMTMLVMFYLATKYTTEGKNPPKKYKYAVRLLFLASIVTYFCATKSSLILNNDTTNIRLTGLIMLSVLTLAINELVYGIEYGKTKETDNEKCTNNSTEKAY